MTSKADRSILKLGDQTRDDGFDDTVLRTTRKKKRVSFSESIAVKTIDSRALENAKRLYEKKEDTGSENKVPTSTPPEQQSKHQFFEFYKEWKSTSDNFRRLSLLSNSDQGSPAPLQPKLTDNRNFTFHMDPDNEDGVDGLLGEFNQQRQMNMTILNATVLPTSRSMLQNDDFSRFLSEEELRDSGENMDISALADEIEVNVRQPEVVTSPATDMDITSDFSTAEENGNTSVATYSNEVAPTYVLNQQEKSSSMINCSSLSATNKAMPTTYTIMKDQGSVIEDEYIVNSSVCKNGPATYTILKDQSSIDEGRDNNFGFEMNGDSWMEPSEISGSMLNFSRDNSKNLSMVKQPMLIPPVPCEDFSSPLRQGRRRTFVVVRRSEDREQRREKMLRDRASIEPAVLPEPAPPVAASTSLLADHLQQEHVEQRQAPLPPRPTKPKEDVPAKATPKNPASVYKYTLPETSNNIDPNELVSFFFNNPKLNVGSFLDVHASITSEIDSENQEPVVSLWEEINAHRATAAAKDGSLATPQRNIAASPHNASFFKWTPSSAEQSVLSPTGISTIDSTLNTPSLDCFEEKVGKLNEKMKKLSAIMERIANAGQFPVGQYPNLTTEKPDFMRRLSADCTYRSVPSTGFQQWQFSSRAGVVKIRVTHTPSPHANSLMVLLMKSRAVLPWLSKFADIVLALIACRLGIPGEYTLRRNVTSESELEAVLLKVDEVFKAGCQLLDDLINCGKKKLLYNPNDNFLLTSRKSHIIAELSAFPVIAVLPGIDICIKASLVIDLDFASYPAPGCVSLKDATFFGAEASVVAAEIMAHFEKKAKELADKSSLSLGEVVVVLTSLSQGS